MDHPPNAKMFDSTHQNSADVSALAKRRLALNNQNINTPSVALNFEGLADVLKLIGFGGASPPLPNNVPQNRSDPQAPPQTPSRSTTRPKILLADFCARYDLSPTIEQKLVLIKIAGPHALRYINNTSLREEAGLELGELADVRDAQERWQSE
jgi:hypothetical protein